MVDAMRKAADATVKGVSAKGTETTDTFSLKGLPRRSTNWRRIASANRAFRLTALYKGYDFVRSPHGEGRFAPKHDAFIALQMPKAYLMVHDRDQ